MALQLTGQKYKYSYRLDKAVKTDKDYIEELELRFEEASDVWKLTAELIYGPDGYFVKMQGLQNKVKELESKLKSQK